MLSETEGQGVTHTHTPCSVKARAEVCQSVYAYGDGMTFFFTLLFLTSIGGAGEREMKGGYGALKATPVKQ